MTPRGSAYDDPTTSGRRREMARWAGMGNSHDDDVDVDDDDDDDDDDDARRRRVRRDARKAPANPTNRRHIRATRTQKMPIAAGGTVVVAASSIFLL